MTRLYLLDVEGTTSPLTLVSEQLFPYARRHLKAYLREHWDEAGTRTDLELLAQECAKDQKQILRLAQEDKTLVPDLEAAYEYLLWLMDRDRKSPALKSLQGKVWKAGFVAGDLVGTVFPDVPGALARWSSEASVAIYSSGSVEAQQLLFRHSSAGDLTPHISGYFDTKTGPKTSPESYRAISRAMDVPTAEVLFVSDVVRELDAARDAGCETRLSVREGNAAVAEGHRHTVWTSFDSE